MNVRGERLTRALTLAAVVLAACDTGGGGSGGSGGQSDMGGGERRDAEADASGAGSGGQGGRGGSEGGSGGAEGGAMGGSIGGSMGGSMGGSIGGSIGGSGGEIGGSGGSAGAGGGGGGCLVNGDCDVGQICVEGTCQDVPLPGACDAPTAIGAPGVYFGDTSGAIDSSQSGNEDCRDTSGGDAAFELAAGLGLVCVRTIGTEFDTVLYARGACAEEESELVCNDDGPVDLTSEIELSVTDTPVYLIVDGYGGEAGPFTLTIDAGGCQVAPGCDDDGDCAEGEVCTDGVCVAEPPPGCDEDLDCPVGQICLDGLCQDVPEIDVCLAPVVIEAFGVYQANTADGGALYDATCGSPESGRELAFAVAGGLGPVCLSTAGSNIDTVLSVRTACSDVLTELACQDDSPLGVRTSEVSLDAQNDPVYVIVDAFFPEQAGPVSLTVSAGPCPEPAACVGDEECAAGEVCRFAPGAEEGVCVLLPFECSVDADCGEGLRCNEGLCFLPPPPDCRVDADCGRNDTCVDGYCTPECVEDADCAPGELCVAGSCAPGLAGGSCEAPAVIAAPGDYAGSTADQPSVYDTSCNGGTGPEVVYQLDPALGAVCVRTFQAEFDTVLSARGACDDEASELVCNDDALLTGSEIAVPAQEGPVYIIVDGFAENSQGQFVLSVTQGDCGDECAADADCPEGLFCSNGECTFPQCQDDAQCAPWAACQDRVCVNLPCADDLGCPEGSICTDGACGPPQCGEFALCPRGYECNAGRCEGRLCESDEGCAEGELCVEGVCLAAPAGDACDAPLAIDEPGTWAGTTVGASDLHDATCGVGNSPEVVYTLNGNLGVVCAEVQGAAFDTVLHVQRVCGSLASEFDCNDDFAAGSFGSRLTIDTAGEPVSLFVDGFGGRSGAYVLTVSAGPCPELVPCADDAECPEGLLCSNGQCLGASCLDDAGCQPFQTCAGGRCLNNPCEGDEQCNGGICELGACQAAQCAQDPDCGPFSVCDLGRCEVQSCEADADCGQGGICVEGICGPAMCQDDLGCAPHAYCDAGRCLPRNCGEDADCPLGTICNDGQCAPAECGEFGGCLPGYACEGGRCVGTPCEGDADCSPGQLCVDALCRDAPNGDACDAPFAIDAYGSYLGNTVDAPSLYGSRCGGDAAGERAFVLGAELGLVCVDTFGSAFDTVLHARRECDSAASALGCNDDAFQLRSALTLDTAGAPIYLFVDGFGQNVGDFVLNVAEGPCPELECNADGDCLPGNTCNNGLCEPIPPPPCQVDDDCFPNETCQDGVCVGGVECVVNEDCAIGEICDGDVCVEAPNACVAPLAIDALGSYLGTTVAGSAVHAGACGGNGAEVVYTLAAGLGTICVDSVGSGFDTVLYSRTACEDAGSETACNDDVAGPGASEITVAAADGPRFLFVDAFGANEAGDFVINVSEGPCACRNDFACGENQHCIEGTCTDIPDGGCLLDVDCDDGSTCVEGECVAPPNACDTAEALPVGNEIHVVASTDEVNGSSQEGSCSAANGPEKVYVLTVPTRSYLNAQVTGFDTVLYLRRDCYDGSTEVACNDDDIDGVSPGSALVEVPLEAGQYFVVVDGFSALQAGEFTLDITLRADCPQGAGNYCGDPGLGQLAGSRYACDAGQYEVIEACAFGCADGACIEGNAGTCEDPMVLPFDADVTVQDDTTRGVNATYAACGGLVAKEIVYRLDVPRAALVDLQVTGFNTVMYLRTDCGDNATTLQCNNDANPPGGGGSRIRRQLEPGTYFVFVDGRQYAEGEFTLHMTTR